MNEDNLYSKIDRYLAGSLEGEELIAFENEIKADAALAEEVYINRGIKIVIEDEIQKEFELNFSAVFNEAIDEIKKNDTSTISTSSERKVRQLRPARRMLALAASIGLLIVAGFTLYNANTNYSDATLAAYDIGEYHTSLGVRGSETTDAFQKGIDAYKANEYTESIKFFSTYKPEDELYSNAQLYAATINLEQKNYLQTEELAQNVIAVTEDENLKGQAEWLLIQTWLLSGKEDAEFHELLNQIVSDKTHFNYKDAVELKRKLNSFWRKLTF